MVADSGETLRTGTGKPVNTPVPVNIEEDTNGLPAAVITRRKQAVTVIIDRWRIDDEWWRSEPIYRFYYAILLASGQRMVVYKDLTGGEWFKQY